ncbi:MAG TPA: class I SAM-dependent methyltransferase [Miltoncostaea sp.]|nr:class I SAM-dependent methyltransferase [Miltoncostaea sp.]
MEVDWGDGDYGRTAAALAPAADALVDVAGIRAGDLVLDVGCGTGNASLAAAARGARVRAVDPSPGLVDLARERATAAGADVEAQVGDAGALPFPDGAFDAVISSFAVIFAPDAEAAVREMVRVARPGGAVALTSWLPGGGIAAAAEVLMSLLPPRPEPRPRWEDPAWIVGMLERAGAPGGTVVLREIAFTAASPEAWFDEHEAHHPVWRALRREAGADAWRSVRERSVAALAAHHDGGEGYRTTSGYAVIRSEREKPAAGA